ncbi:MAG: hypothetical protein IJ191_05545 [Treponema sp.]|nr:hypothetical protein [Treponema sp.]
MTYCSYTDLLRLLRERGATVIGTEPSCPKQLDSFCIETAGHCEQGNRRDCEQPCTVMTERGGRYRFQVLFVYHANSREGYIVKESLCIQNLIERKVIRESDLTELAA